MRRSAAPSQLAGVSKKGRFCPPFLSLNNQISSGRAPTTGTIKPGFPTQKGDSVGRSEDGGRLQPNAVQKPSTATTRKQLVTEPTSNVRSSVDILRLVTTSVPVLTEVNADQDENEFNSKICSTQEPSPFDDTLGDSLLACDNFARPAGNQTDNKERTTAPLVECTSNKSLAAATDERVPTWRYFSVVWCKLSKKKHKKWEGDAILEVRERSVTLKDLEGKEIGRGSGYKLAQLAELEEGQLLAVGGKEVEIMGTVSTADFTSGKCFQQPQAPVEPEPPATTGKHN